MTNRQQAVTPSLRNIDFVPLSPIQDVEFSLSQFREEESKRKVKYRCKEGERWMVVLFQSKHLDL